MLEKWIDEYEQLEKISNIEHSIIKAVDKAVIKLWRDRSSDQYKYSFKEFEKNLEIENWGTTDTGNHIAVKIVKLIKIYDKLEKRNDHSINIDKLRNHENRKELKEREKNRKETMDKLYEQIINKKIEVNIRKRELYLEEDIDIYENLMIPIRMEELESVLNNLKSNKAPGQSGISYDFWKKSKTLTRKLLLEIINDSMLEENAIDDWKKGIIYPINKTTRSDWNQELSLTRPIVLLETARKIWFKILVNRLNDILTREQVLMNTNFAALKNESTLESIKIIQAIIEDANNYSKEA
ncbi:hypothetical protein RhiirA5_435087 [Rhizophagus irregularis]|uniref:Reverse transcriptase n=1 Tax=Rhizophagus irregularis TaxID=588596 RepID=A0A2N0NP22_9GLOM|nr:hypothetical protein RhiirA5_435087 [Rhizophagus irregularis]